MGECAELSIRKRRLYIRQDNGPAQTRTSTSNSHVAKRHEGNIKQTTGTAEGSLSLSLSRRGIAHWPDKHSHIRTGHPLICFSKNDNILSKFPTFFFWFFESFFVFPTAKCLVPVYVRRNRRPRLYHGRPRTCRNKRGTGGNE